MPSSARKLDKDTYHVEVEHNGRVYTDNVGADGLKGLMEVIGEDNSYYPIAEKMLKAIDKAKSKKTTNKTEGGSNEVNYKR